MQQKSAISLEKQSLKTKRSTTLVIALTAGLIIALLPLSSHASKAKHQPTHHAAPPFSSESAVKAFIVDMHERYGFDVAQLSHSFAAIRPNAAVLRAIRPAAVPEQQRSWERYRARFINARRIENGRRFCQEHKIALKRAEAIYGVPAEIIVAIIGVETEYGRNMGRFSVLEALASLAFHYPPRADFFRKELEQFLLLARENDIDPLRIKGSYAGAIGIPQFMPSSQRRFAVDFDGDQRIDLYGSAEDAIGSVASFLQQHGWQTGEPIAIAARVVPEDTAAPNIVAYTGNQPTVPLREFIEQGVIAIDTNSQDAERPAVLIDLVTPETSTEYWFGFRNFYALMRYNRSSFYAMSVFQLATEIADNP